MILQFVIAALLLLVIFAVFMIKPFTGQKSKTLINKERRNQLNHELYDIRIKEVEDDISQGVVVDKEAMVAELQYNLLDDIDENVQSKQNDAKRIWIPGVAFLVLASVALYWSIGAFKEVNDWQNALQRYPEIHKKLTELYNAGLSLKSVELIHSSEKTEFENVTREKLIEQNVNLISSLGKDCFYWEVFDPTYEKENEPTQGWLVDDVADIYADLKEELYKINQIGTDEAIEDGLWQLKFGFTSHWGNHCVNAIRALHYIYYDGKTTT